MHVSHHHEPDTNYTNVSSFTFPSKKLNCLSPKMLLFAPIYSSSFSSFNGPTVTLSIQISGYAHAKQFKRMRKSLRILKCYLGRVFRDVKRKATLEVLGKKDLSHLLSLVEKLLNQFQTSKNKVYSLHAPEVECFAKGKAHKQYEFWNKVALMIPLKTPFVVGINSLQGNPYDGHTLESSLQQVLNLTGIKVDQAFVDQGYKGHSVQDTEVFFSRQKRGITKTFKKHIKRRQAIEPIIGHLKEDGKLGRNYLKGIKGDEINALLSEAGFNIRTILNKINLIFQDFSYWILLQLNSKVRFASLQTP
jgi:IS5 family transposase